MEIPVGGIGRDFSRDFSSGLEAVSSPKAPASGAQQPLPNENLGNFADILKSSLEEVNTHQVQADHAVSELVAGRSKNIHETMLAIERADLSMKLMMQVRNKALEAYREIMRMQV